MAVGAGRTGLWIGRGLLAALQERDLSKYDLVAMFLDGKTFGEDQMVIAMGVMVQGRKVVLGFVQTATENEAV